MSDSRQADIAARIARAIDNQDDQEKAAFITGILEEITTPKTPIPEPVFREIFLPYFTGEKEIDKNNDAIKHWIGLVGSASEPADVVDASGRVLFTVPPVCDTDVVRVAVAGRQGIGSIMTNYVSEAETHPALGRNFLAEALSRKIVETLPTETDKSQGWTKILAHYGKLPTKVVEETRVNRQIMDEDLDFGD